MSVSDDRIISQHLQDSFVSLCIHSDEFLGLVRPVLLPGFFTSVVSENCVQICYDFFDQFKKAPGKHFFDEFERRKPGIREDDLPFYDQYFKIIGELKPDLDYMVSRVNNFVRSREYETAAVKFAEMVKDGEYETAQNLMYKALSSGLERENIGCDYTEDLSSLSRRNETADILTGFGIDEFDRMIGGGFKRTQLVCVLGGYKGKKSWALQHIARTATLRGLKVLYVSHELSREQLERRFDRMFGAMITSPEAREVEIRVRENNGFKMEKEVRPSVFDIEAVKKVRHRVARYGGRLILKKYPIGTCTIGELNRYLNYLERFERFVPDVLITDYADIMAFEGRGGDQTRHGINEIYLAHKTIADERNILVVTASQVNRDGIRRKRPTQKDVSEDIRKLANVDSMIGVCQTDEMAEQGVGSLWLIVNREGVMDVGCSFLMNLDIGQFCTSSWLD